MVQFRLHCHIKIVFLHCGRTGVTAMHAVLTAPNKVLIIDKGNYCECRDSEKGSVHLLLYRNDDGN